MANPIFFKAIIHRVDYFEDTNQTRVIAKLTHATETPGADPTWDLSACRLAEPILASFRLQGPDALKQYAEYYYNGLPKHREVCPYEGGVIFFTARAVGEGKADRNGVPLRVLIGFDPETLSFQERRKRVELVFAGNQQVSMTFEADGSVSQDFELPSEDDLFDDNQEVMSGVDAADLPVDLAEIKTGEPQGEEVLA